MLIARAPVSAAELVQPPPVTLSGGFWLNFCPRGGFCCSPGPERGLMGRSSRVRLGVGVPPGTTFGHHSFPPE